MVRSGHGAPSDNETFAFHFNKNESHNRKQFFKLNERDAHISNGQKKPKYDEVKYAKIVEKTNENYYLTEKVSDLINDWPMYPQTPIRSLEPPHVNAIAKSENVFFNEVEQNELKRNKKMNEERMNENCVNQEPECEIYYNGNRINPHEMSNVCLKNGQNDQSDHEKMNLAVSNEKSLNEIERVNEFEIRENIKLHHGTKYPGTHDNDSQTFTRESQTDSNFQTNDLDRNFEQSDRDRKIAYDENDPNETIHPIEILPDDWGGGGKWNHYSGITNKRQTPQN